MPACSWKFLPQEITASYTHCILGEDVRKIVSIVLLSLLLVGVPAVTFDIRPVEAEALLVLEMEVSNTTITIGEKINITLVLKNVGNTTFTRTYSHAPAPVFNAYYFTPSDWVFKYDPYGGIWIPWIVDVIIEPGANITTTLKWDLYKQDFSTGLRYPPPPGNYNLYGCCDLTHPGFLSLLMNDLFVPVTVVGDWWNHADINYDFKIDIHDLVTTANAYGSTPADPNWNILCDIAEPYGIINIIDLVLMASSYGEEYTP
jgi:hypothetical protein